jgi:hypothetical protein
LWEFRYLGDVALPNFKKNKVAAYYEMMKELSGAEQTNLSNMLESWKVIYNGFNAKTMG